MPTVFETPLSFPEHASRERVLSELSRIFENGSGVAEAVGGATLERERTSATFLGRGLAVPHGRTAQIDAIRIAVGFSKTGVPWPDADSRAHLILLLGVPVAMVREYLLLMQKILRWHKDTRTLDASGRVLDATSLLSELRALAG